MRAAVVLFTVAGCSYQPSSRGGDGGTSDGPGPDGFGGSIDVAHLGRAEEDQLIGDTAWTIDESTIIDTAAGTISPAPPSGLVVIKGAAQEGAGPAVMVIQATTIEITSDLRIVGDRPLILVATTSFRLIDSTIDVSAQRATPGAGGFASGLGPGAGAASITGLGEGDSGAGGASHGALAPGSVGGPPGTELVTGGAAGVPYGGPNILLGGSGGGNATANGVCASAGGAGGGALQITAPMIELEDLGGAALINAGGGGGAGGISCADDGPGGAGGGSGGMVFLDAPMMIGDGSLIALGGGGGEGGGTGGNSGDDGSDAGTSAGGGGNGDTDGGDGGRGANAATAVPGNASTADGGNGGGGGGGSGRIYFRGPSQSAYTSTPAAEPG